MPSRITIEFAQGERAALDELARREYRDVRQQAAVIIRRELERRGLLPEDNGAADDRQAPEVQHGRTG